MLNNMKPIVIIMVIVFAVAAYNVFGNQTMEKGVFQGEMAHLTIYETPIPLPDYIIQREDGTPIKISDLKGRVLLINLWASWCAPCRAEMKDIAELQEKLGGPKFEVVALNEDRGGLKKAEITLKEWGVEGLPLYADKTTKTAYDMAGGKLPTSYVVNKKGMIVAEYVGTLDWASEDAIALFQSLIDQ